MGGNAEVRNVVETAVDTAVARMKQDGLSDVIAFETHSTRLRAASSFERSSSSAGSATES